MKSALFYYKITKNITFSQMLNRCYLSREASKLKGRILDLGCGNGEYSFRMSRRKNNHVVALDISLELCGVIRQKVARKGIGNIEIVETDGHSLPFKDDSFDACFCNTVLEHVKDPIQIVQEIQRVLKKGGRLIISIPFLQEIHADPHDFQRYTSYGLRHLLEKHGLRVVKQYCDYGSLNVLEYLLLGSIVWRLRLGFARNFPFGHLYIGILGLFFVCAKLSAILFQPLQHKDKHFMTMVVLHAVKQ